MQGTGYLMSEASRRVQDKLKLAAASAGVFDPILLLKPGRMPVFLVVALCQRLTLDPVMLFQSCECACEDAGAALAKSA